MFNLSLNVRHAVRVAITGAAAVASTAALAQTAATSTAPPKELEEVIVTGTRIQASPNEISVAPVATISATDIAQTGLMRVEDVLNSLPQVIAEQSSGQAISADGTASVSLRGLGSYRTLVLINGRRMQPGAGLINASSPDINQIPAAMIERIDVLTGGASATYGADAVAGVVNFIMNTHFQGVRLDFDYGQNMYGQNVDFAQNVIARREYSGAGQLYGRPEPQLVVHGGFQLCRRQRQCHGLRHIHQHLTGGRQSARLRRMHAQHVDLGSGLAAAGRARAPPAGS